MPVQKSFFELSVDELKSIIDTGLLPENVSLEGMSARPDFEMLFKMRQSPVKIAKYLLGATPGQKLRKSSLSYVPSIPQHLREEKIHLKREELRIKELKLKQNTVVLEKVEEMVVTLNGLNKRLTSMETVLKRLVSLTIERGGMNEHK